MKKIIAVIIIISFLFVAYRTKPDDRTCTLKGVKAVWGKLTPTETKPVYFEQFM